MAKFVDSKAFKGIAHQVFKTIDKNKNGELCLEELTIAMCHLHYKLAKKSPGVSEPPTKEAVVATMQRYDMNADGALTEDEFMGFAKKWFDTSGAVFFRRLIVTSFISMVVLPESAAILRRELPLARQVPKVVFKVLFGVIFKLVVQRLPARQAS